MPTRVAWETPPRNCCPGYTVKVLAPSAAIRSFTAFCAQLVGADGLEGDRDGLADQHAYLPPLCDRMPGTPPPPVIRLTRCWKSFCDWISPALGSSSTESDACSPLVTSL